MQEYTINGKILKFKPHEFEGKKSIEYYENQIITALDKIAVTKDYVIINYSDEEQVPFAQVEWKINGQDFVFRCQSQKTTVQNLGAIAQAIQEDVRQITRGIKDLFAIMNQYKSAIKITKRKNLFDFGTTTDTNKEMFSIKDIQSQTEVHEDLDPKYIYLTKYSTDKLDMFYMKFKEECIRNNSLNHPLLKALKIIRQNRGLKL